MRTTEQVSRWTRSTGRRSLLGLGCLAIGAASLAGCWTPGGTGPAQLVVSIAPFPSEVDCGDQCVASTLVTVTNTGQTATAAPLSIAVVANSPSVGSVGADGPAPCTGAALAPGAGCTVSLTVNPTSAGTDPGVASGAVSVNAGPLSDAAAYSVELVQPGPERSLDQAQQATGACGTWVLGALSGVIAQTFEVGVTGDLDQVALFASNVANPSAPLAVEIRAVGGTRLPTGSVLASGSLAAKTATTDWRTVSLTSPLAVVSGTSYAVLVSSAGAQGEWHLCWDDGDLYSKGANVYADGPAGPWNQVPGTDADLRFRTYVTH